MSSHPENPLFECHVPSVKDCTSVLVYLTHDGFIFLCAPYVDPPYFTAEQADAVCEAIQKAAGLARQREAVHA